MSNETGEHIRTNEKRIGELLAEGWKPPATMAAAGRLGAGGFGRIGLRYPRFHLGGAGAILARSALLLSRLPRIPRLSAPSRLEVVNSPARGPLSFPSLSGALHLQALRRDSAASKPAGRSSGSASQSLYPRDSQEYPKLVWTWGVGGFVGDLEHGQVQVPLGIDSSQLEPGEPEEGDPRYAGGHRPGLDASSTPRKQTTSRLDGETRSGAEPSKFPPMQRKETSRAGIRIDGRSVPREPEPGKAEWRQDYASKHASQAVLSAREFPTSTGSGKSSVWHTPLLSSARPPQLAALAKRQEDVWFAHYPTDLPAARRGPQPASSISPSEALPFEALPLRKPTGSSEIGTSTSPSDRQSEEGSPSLLSLTRSTADRVLQTISRVLAPKGQARPSVGAGEDAASPRDVADLAAKAATSLAAKPAERGDREEPHPPDGETGPWSMPGVPSARASGARSTLESREQVVQSRVRETHPGWRFPRLVDVGRSVAGVLRSRATGKDEVREGTAAIGGPPESAGMPEVDQSPLERVPSAGARPADLSAQRRASSGQGTSTRPRSATARSEASLRVAEKAVEPGASGESLLPPHAADKPDKLERVGEVAATTYPGSQTSVEVSSSRPLPIANRLLGARLMSRWIGPQESTVVPTGLASRQPRRLAIRFDHPAWPRPTAGRTDDTRVGSPLEPEPRKSERWQPVRAASFAPSHESIEDELTENESTENARLSEAGRAATWAEIERPAFQARSQRRRDLSFLGEDTGVLDGAELVHAPVRARAADPGTRMPDTIRGAVSGGRSNWINLSLAPADRVVRVSAETSGTQPDAASAGEQAERGLVPKEIDELSNTVYRLLKQRLAVERERAVGFRSEFFG